MRKKIKTPSPSHSFTTDRRPLGMYIHIPFCRRKCDYCDFYSLAGADELIGRYVSALIRHISEAAPQILSNVDTIYFGGGTPGLIGSRNLESVLKTVKKKYSVTPDCEITSELNPESTDKKLLSRLFRAGFNRLSFGVQSFSDSELKKLGRLHSASDAKRAISEARSAGFSNISLDLMYGIEGQDMQSLRESLAEAVSLAPEHISCYGLKVEEGTPLQRRLADISLPDDDTQADMYLLVCELLRSAGYIHYEISNWSKPGFESRHNLKYWNLDPYIGFGPAAHSDCFGLRYSNIRDLTGYVEGIENGGSILDEHEEISPGERAAEYIMLRLRTSKGIDGEEFSRRFSLPFDGIERVMKSLEPKQLTSFDGSWRLTDRGFLLSNSIIVMALDALDS